VIRALLITPLIALLTVAVGLGVSKLMGRAAHLHEMAAALAIAIAASELAMVPLLLVRNSSQMAVSQAALGGMVIHLLFVAGAVAIMPFDRPFIIWLAALYGATLITLSIVNISALRIAPVAKSPDAKPQSAVADGSVK
jgi:hypothetical protein